MKDSMMEMAMYRSLRNFHLKKSGLETMEFQTKMFQTLFEMDPEMKKEIVQLQTLGRNYLGCKLTENIFKSGDERMITLIACVPEHVDETASEVHKIMFSDRNHAWMKVVRKVSNSHVPTAFVVGAGHLYGKDGILNLSRQEGWTVERCHDFAWPTLSGFDPSTSKSFEF